jgi:hypothetical protein
MNLAYVALLGGGFVLLWMGTAQYQGLAKYELQHARNGRVVHFDTYEDFDKHESQKDDAEWTASIGLLFILAGSIGLVAL